MWSFFSRDPSKDFHYDIGEPISGLEDRCVWKLHRGKKKGSTECVTVFVFDVKNSSDTQLELAKASLKRLKTLRHPNVTTYLDSLETDKLLYLVTEYVEPLSTHLTSSNDNGKRKELGISWGLHQIAKGLSFLSNDCSLVHNNVCLWSIFVNQAGEWKLGSLEYMCPFGEGTPLPIKILPLLEKYDPPEKIDASRRSAIAKWSVDMWGFGCLIWEVFNGPLPNPSALKNTTKIPKSLIPLYCELVGANPAARPNPTAFLTRGRSQGGFFNNNFVNTLLFLDEIQIKDSTEKTKFFNNLSSALDSFPSEVCKYKILPLLINAYEFGNAGSAVLSPMFKLGKLLDEEEYQKKIVPCVVKLFSSTDRATRARLLQQLEHFVDHLQPSLVNEQIFPQILHGFMDTNPTIRETTVKAMLYLAPKLNYNNLNVELMKHFARLQAKDDQGGIRTNTTVCLGKIASNLHPQIRQKVLIPAFARALRDPFPPARTAGILALAATQSSYPLKDVATKILPVLCAACIDPERAVRDQAFKTVKGFLGKLEKVSENPALAEEMEAEVNLVTSPSVADTAASWAGWAVTSLTSKLYKTTDKPKKKATAHTSSHDATPSSANKATSPAAASSNLDVTVGKGEADASSTGRPESISDNEDNWNDDWGEMDSSSQQTGNQELQPSLTAGQAPNAAGDGWDDEDWGSMDDTTSSPTDQLSSSQGVGSGIKGWEDAWEGEQFVPADPNLKPASAYNWGDGQSTTSEEFFSKVQSAKNQPSLATKGKPSVLSSTEPDKWKSTEQEWNIPDDKNDTWESWEDQAHNTKAQREERRLQRQRELQEKREARQSSGAMKLGARKKPGNS